MAGVEGCSGDWPGEADVDLSKKFTFSGRPNGPGLPIARKREEILDIIGGRGIIYI